LYAVLGENGAGKTTLLRVVAGLTKPTKGDVSVPSTEAALNRRSIGYMAHASLLYDELNGLENLRYFAGLYGIRNARHCEDLMRRVGLDPGLTRRVGDYSQGMKQRLSLARAIIHDPSVLLFDEPFSNLDAASAREIAGLLAGMRSSGKCVLVVTHQAGLLKEVADESLLLTQGQLTARAQGVAAEWSMDKFQKGSA
jgi:ABC-type multidrug transport system ATPase subunit